MSVVFKSSSVPSAGGDDKAGSQRQITTVTLKSLSKLSIYCAGVSGRNSATLLVLRVSGHTQSFVVEQSESEVNQDLSTRKAWYVAGDTHV